MSFNQCTDEVAYCKKTGYNYNPALRDPQLRLAVEYAIDRQTLVDRVRPGYAAVGTTVVNQPRWHVDPENPIPYDPEEANRILDEAGYADTDGDGDPRDAGRGRAPGLPVHRANREPRRRSRPASSSRSGWRMSGSRRSPRPSTTRSSPTSGTRTTTTCTSGAGASSPTRTSSSPRTRLISAESGATRATRTPSTTQLFKEQQAAPTVEERAADRRRDAADPARRPTRDRALARDPPRGLPERVDRVPGAARPRTGQRRVVLPIRQVLGADRRSRHPPPAAPAAATAVASPPRCG